MNLGVLLLTCQEGRGTTFTRAWAERAIGRVADYMFAQSGGRETITFKVFDWIQLAQTEAEWSGLGFGAYSTLKPSLEQTIGESLDPFTHILIGIDHSTSTGGTTPGAFTYLAASNSTPSFIAHELGHRYGADDAFRETPTGPRIYWNNFCVMGAEGWPYVFADPVLADPTAPMLNGSGPGMSAPTLMGAKWLNEDQHGLGFELSDNNLFSSGGAVVELSALAGAPGPNWNRPPVVIRYQDLVIEYRVKASDGWDRGLAEPGDGAGGWVVVHRSERGAPRAVYVNSVAARPGAVLLLGKDDPLDLFNPGPVRISVLSFDAKARTVRFHVGRRAASERLPSGTIYGGVDVGGGGLVWTPGKGFTKVPPHSPLIKVMEEVVRIQALQEMMAVASRSELEALEHEAAHVMEGLRASVSGLQVQPSVSPLAHALENVSRLHSASEAVGPDGGDGAARKFIETSRQQLAEVKQLLARAVEEESRL